MFRRPSILMILDGNSMPPKTCKMRCARRHSAPTPTTSCSPPRPQVAALVVVGSGVQNLQFAEFSNLLTTF